MQNYDWIVIGGGITGSALSYELMKKGWKTLLIEKDPILKNATQYSYGGLAYWSANNPLTRQLYQQGMALHRHLSVELDGDTEFRDIDLLLTIDKTDNPEDVINECQQFVIAPQLLAPVEAHELEPELNPDTISGAIRFPHAHINPNQTNLAYQKAFSRLGGRIVIEQFQRFHHKNQQIVAVETQKQVYGTYRVVVCAGGLSRSLLKAIGVEIPLYFTHSSVLITETTNLILRTMIMPARQKRLALEAIADTSKLKPLWDFQKEHCAGQILDPGAIQFQDKHMRIGQTSTLLTNPQSQIDIKQEENQIRQHIARLLPNFANIPGICRHCLVAFSPTSRPLVGETRLIKGLYHFSGFTSTLISAPPMARHFADSISGSGIAQINRLEMDMNNIDNQDE